MEAMKKYKFFTSIKLIKIMINFKTSGLCIL